MYVVKVGDYYVQSINVTMGQITEILLSKEMMRNFIKATAETIAKKTNGEVIKMDNQVTMCEEDTKQLSIFDDEVANANT
jgi:hypothetical protein